ncbi:hypothetical protein FACUT_2911 [Fusarium acutatum]|uniref:Uncharacterized protein n=1 Tax=Fusarium acutatum TaxID=78861 RepID=A0A8H4K1S9_9HYPO|nr:hypothetical protein FACUT_2911 [Fusarium acutatum]
MLTPAPRLIQLEAHFIPFQTEFEVPKKGAFAKACGTKLCKQVYDHHTGLLTFTFSFNVISPMTSPRTSKEFLWGVLKRMGVFDGWYYYRIFVMDERMAVLNSFFCELREWVKSRQRDFKLRLPYLYDDGKGYEPCTGP